MRMTAVRKGCEQHHVDACVLTNLQNIYYVTGFLDIAGATVSLLVPLDGPATLFVPTLSYEAARAAAANCAVEVVPKGVKPVARLHQELTARRFQAVGFDDLPLAAYLQLTADGAPPRVRHLPRLVADLRRVKDAQEIAWMKEAAAWTDVGARVGMEWVRAGVREYEVAAEIEYAMRRRGSEGAAFETVVASGPRSAHPHGVASDRVIARGDAVVLDLGAVYRGYRCDITRTVFVGAPSPQQAAVFQAVMGAHDAALQGMRDGVEARGVDQQARQVLAAQGWDAYFIHGLGHGVGLDIHEPPTLSPESEDILVAGNVVTDEPGVYLPGFGVRIEDTVLIQREDGQKLTQAPYGGG